VDFAPRAPTSSPARVSAIADEFPQVFCFLEFATGILNCGVGMMIYLEVPNMNSQLSGSQPQHRFREKVTMHKTLVTSLLPVSSSPDLPDIEVTPCRD
jgi:hypothetical protein